MKTAKKSNSSFDKAKFIKRFSSNNSNSHKNTSCVLSASTKAIKSKRFSEQATYNRKMPNLFLFQKHPNKST